MRQWRTSSNNQERKKGQDFYILTLLLFLRGLPFSQESLGKPLVEFVQQFSHLAHCCQATKQPVIDVQLGSGVRLHLASFARPFPWKVVTLSTKEQILEGIPSIKDPVVIAKWFPVP